jgi:murein DD-endopeptidase MepM/ murein hydrolase activator NlpD
MKRGDWTVIVARFAETPARRYSLPRKLVVGVSTASLVLLACFVLSTLHYYQMWKKTSEYDRLKVEVDQLRKENDTFRLAADHLSDKFSALEVTSKKLSILSGLDREGMGGLGGPVTRPSPLAELGNRELVRHLNDLGRRSVGLEFEYRRLQDFYNNRSILLAATPAIAPVNGYPSGSYGYRLDPFSGARDFHPGLDISAAYGNPVVATADGLVTSAGHWVAYGKLVVIDHKFNVATRYGHLSRVSVRVGQRVKKGDIIGYVGSTGRATGPHLHYEVRLGGQPVNPLLFFRENS